MNRVIGVTAAAGCAALALAGCGSTHASSGAPAGTAPASTSPVPRTSTDPAKPSSERITAAATVVTVSPVSRLVAGAKVPAPVTITNAVTVRRLAALVNGLPRATGVTMCPADFGQEVQLMFGARKGGVPLAVVTAAKGGCGGVRFIAAGKPQPALSGPGLAGQALAIAGLRWNGYGGVGGHLPGRLPGGVNPGGVMQPG